MKENKVAEAIGKVDDRFINEAGTYQRKKKNIYSSFVKIAVAAACLVMLVGMSMFGNTRKVDSIVSIDVNPSIQLTVSKDDKILSAVALNKDAEIVLNGMELKKVDLDTALNALIGSLLKNGYLDEVYNAINVCVENNDTQRADEVSEKVKQEINSLMEQNDLIGDVNSQTCPVDEELKALAEKYGVSVGKLTLAQKVAENLNIPLEVAVRFSISELWELSEAEDVELLTKDEVVEIAVKDAGIDGSEMVLTHAKIKETAGIYVYDIKFTVDGTSEYKYKIDAVKGAVIEFEFKLILKEEPVTPQEPVKQITKNEALQFAYQDAGVDAANAELEELLHRPKEMEYHIEFSVGLMEYYYVINGVDGSVISKEVIEKTPVVEEPETVIPGVVTTIEDALKIALAKAGVNQADLTMCDIKYHIKKEGPEYKVHFHVDKAHYEYIINPLTGECVEKKRPEPPTPPVPPVEKEKPIPPHEKDAVAKPAPKAPEGPAAPKAPGPKDTKVTIEFVETE